MKSLVELENLVGTRVKLMVSDPWEFGTEVGSGPFYGVVERTKESDLLLSLEKPIRFRTVGCSHMLASPRHVGTGFDRLITGTQVPASLVLITKAVAEGPDPFSPERWTRGAGLIGSIRLRSAR